MNMAQQEYLRLTIDASIPSTHPDYDKLQANVKLCVEQIEGKSVTAERERCAKEAKDTPDVCDCADRIAARIRGE